MTTDLSPSGIQRLLKMCEASSKPYVKDTDLVIATLGVLARAALPDALRQLYVAIGQRDMVSGALDDFYEQLGCEHDNEAGLLAVDALQSAASASRDRIAALEAAIQWVLGEGDSDFGDNKPPNPGPFWWRDELKSRAVLSGGNGE